MEHDPVALLAEQVVGAAGWAGLGTPASAGPATRSLIGTAQPAQPAQPPRP
jgi:hypothetical protein